MDIASKEFWYSKEIPGSVELANVRLSEVDSEWLGKKREEILEYLATGTTDVWKEVEVLRGNEWDKVKQQVNVKQVALCGLNFCDDGTYRINDDRGEVVNSFGRIVGQDDAWFQRFLLLCKTVLEMKEGERTIGAWGCHIGKEYHDGEIAVAERRDYGDKRFVIMVGDELVCDTVARIFKDGIWREKIWDKIGKAVSEQTAELLSKGLEWTTETRVIQTYAPMIAKKSDDGKRTRVTKYRDDGYGLVVKILAHPSDKCKMVGIEMRYDKKRVFRSELISLDSKFLRYSLYGKYEYWCLHEYEKGVWLNVFAAMVDKAEQEAIEAKKQRKLEEEKNRVRLGVIELAKKYFCVKKKASKSGILGLVSHVYDSVMYEFYWDKWSADLGATSIDPHIYSDRMIRIARDIDSKEISIYSYEWMGRATLVCDESGCFVKGRWYDHFMELIEKKKMKQKRQMAKEWNGRPSPDDYIREIRES